MTLKQDMKDDSTTALPVMIGTAGHVDHGKTSLVRALTGYDTDSLKEEKARGLTIDLAVAPWTLEGLGRVGIIDVPGHEDFVRNMVAGAASIDILLLVVAADDAVMPQTMEHLRILKVLGVKDLKVVLSKIDLVDDEMLALVKEEVVEVLEAAGWHDAPIFPVSNNKGDGIEHLRAHLIEELGRRKNSPLDEPRTEQAFRMYVRHVFSLKGLGTVVTGVPTSGRIFEGDAIELLPAQKASSVRGIQTYRQTAAATQAHVSSAINIRDIEMNEVERGMCIASPGVFRQTHTALVYIRNEHPEQELGKRGEYRFLSGTAAVVSRMRLLGSDTLAPAQGAFAHVSFLQPVVFGGGDRFILRNLSPADTVGGGTVLGVNVARVRSSSEHLLPRLTRARQELERGDSFSAALFCKDSPVVQADELPELAQLPRQAAAKALEGLGVRLAPLGSSQWLVEERLVELQQRLIRHLERYHRENPYTMGMQPSYAARLFRVDAAASYAFAKLLVEGKEIEMRHGCLALKSYVPEISEKLLRLKESFEALLAEVGDSSIAEGDALDRLSARKEDFKKVSKILIAEGRISKLGNNYLLNEHMQRFREILLELFKRKEVVELKDVREATNLGRNLAVTMLEAFDSEGLTRRSGAGRVLAQKRALEGE